MENIDEQKSYNLLLQKQITSLKKEKVDLISQIGFLNTKLDDIEKDINDHLVNFLEDHPWMIDKKGLEDYFVWVNKMQVYEIISY